MEWGLGNCKNIGQFVWTSGLRVGCSGLQGQVECDPVGGDIKCL